MTKEDVIRMAREAGVIPIDNPRGMELIWWSISVEELERFAALVSAAKQEECAKVAENMSHYFGYQCAAAIRALK